MADPRFFKKNKESYTVTELAEITKSKVIGDAGLIVENIARLDAAKGKDITFFSNPKYKKQFTVTQASVCICDENSVAFAREGMTLLVNPNPYHAYALITKAFFDHGHRKGNISQHAYIDSTATIGKDVYISDFAVIGRNVKIGDNCFIGSNTVICDSVEIGNNTKIMHNVSVSHSLIGNDCAIFSGCRIGQDGFGYAPSAQGIVKVEQLGRVVIGNQVDIGANSCIDRGAIEDTTIGNGTKIDNLVQIGHNVRIGMNCFVVSQVGIAGSTTIGDGVIIGGQVGIAGHINIGKGVMIAGQSGVKSDIEPGAAVGGSPALPIKQWFRVVALLKKMTSKEYKPE